MIDDPSLPSIYLRQLYTEHGESLLRFLRSKGASEDEAQDLAQETYLRVCRRGRLVDGAGRERSFLFKIAQNLLIDRCRRTLLRHRLDDVLSVQRDLAHILGPQSPEQVLLAKQDLGVVRRTLEDLTSIQRAVVVLRRFHGLRLKEIAKQLGVSERTVERHLQRFLELLEERLRFAHDGAAESTG
ncbi:MAG: RNA polymerase sigma factor [Deltaproteobacteria bacterium]|nr:RNA polymerase sigma factor [Deltaproteobacteria bacterium]